VTINSAITSTPVKQSVFPLINQIVNLFSENRNGRAVFLLLFELTDLTPHPSSSAPRITLARFLLWFFAHFPYAVHGVGPGMRVAWYEAAWHGMVWHSQACVVWHGTVWHSRYGACGEAEGRTWHMPMALYGLREVWKKYLAIHGSAHDLVPNPNPDPNTTSYTNSYTPYSTSYYRLCFK
jgi:hypothetical protein